MMVTPAISSELFVARYRSPGHPHHGRLVARHVRGDYFLRFTDDPAQARTVRKSRFYEWNRAFIHFEPLPAPPAILEDASIGEE